MIAFFMTNFVYPVFYYPTNPDYSVFTYPFNVNVITKSTAIAYLGYSFFLLGISNYNEKYHNEERELFVFTEIKFNWLFIFTIVFFVLYILSGGLEALKNVYSGEGDITEVSISSYFYVLFSIACTLMVMFLFRQNTTKRIVAYGFIISFFLLLLLATGTRGFIVGIALIIIFTYNSYISKISRFKLVLLIALGSIVLTIVAYGRSTSISDGNWINEFKSNAEITSIFDFFGDLIMNNRNLYVLVDFADTVQYTYFFGMLSDIVSPIPGLFRYIISLVGVPKELMTAGGLPTFLEFGPDSSWGLGTNMVGEAYVAFGLYGVILSFFLFGYIVKISREAAEYNIYAYMIYYMFVSLIISYPRCPIFVINRNLAWGLLLIFALNLIGKRRYQSKLVS